MKPTENVPNNINDMRNQLCDIFARVQKDSAFVPLAHEASNAAGKIIKSLSLELEYQNHIGKKTAIPFMNK